MVGRRDDERRRAPQHRVGDLDAAVDGVFAGLRGRPAADRVFYTASRLGDDGRLWLGLLALHSIRRERRRWAVLCAGWLGVESVLVNGPFKMATSRPRPGLDHGQAHPHRLRTERTSSFPSGHSASGALMATLLSEGSPAGPLYWGVALTIAASRVHVRAHHATDVVAGLAVGTTIGLVARVVNRRLGAGPHDRAPVEPV